MGMKVIIKELEQSADRVPEYQISDLIRKIKSHKRIFVYGTGRSGLMLKALAMRLAWMHMWWEKPQRRQWKREIC